jgi:hypothetical protein
MLGDKKRYRKIGVVSHRAAFTSPPAPLLEGRRGVTESFLITHFREHKQ